AEELKAKYAKILEESKVDDTNSDAQPEQPAIDEDENFESILDSDESVTMDSELDEDDEDEESSDEESDAGGSWGLAGFYSDFAPKKKAESESVVEAEDDVDEEYGEDAMEVDGQKPKENGVSEENQKVQPEEQPDVVKTPAPEPTADATSETQPTEEKRVEDV